MNGGNASTSQNGRSSKWTFAPRMGESIRHERNCGICDEYTRHILDADMNGDPSLDGAREALRRHLLHELEQCKQEIERLRKERDGSRTSSFATDGGNNSIYQKGGQSRWSLSSRMGESIRHERNCKICDEYTRHVLDADMNGECTLDAARSALRNHLLREHEECKKEIARLLKDLNDSRASSRRTPSSSSQPKAPHDTNSILQNELNASINEVYTSLLGSPRSYTAASVYETTQSLTEPPKLTNTTTTKPSDGSIHPNANLPVRNTASPVLTYPEAQAEQHNADPSALADNPMKTAPAVKEEPDDISTLTPLQLPSTTTKLAQSQDILQNGSADVLLKRDGGSPTAHHPSRSASPTLRMPAPSGMASGTILPSAVGKKQFTQPPAQSQTAKPPVPISIPPQTAIQSAAPAIVIGVSIEQSGSWAANTTGHSQNTHPPVSITSPCQASAQKVAPESLLGSAEPRRTNPPTPKSGPSQIPVHPRSALGSSPTRDSEPRTVNQHTLSSPTSEPVEGIPAKRLINTDGPPECRRKRARTKHGDKKLQDTPGVRPEPEHTSSPTFNKPNTIDT
ncbi:hypothetical protein V5O48_001189 [Marasmius crinis-equi]|uniref:Uncharacterized protein n=1 Tax=Marasmius crinis-equi TaxID=585013 RepID=A0ABR3FZ42_9AGAR